MPNGSGMMIMVSHCVVAALGATPPSPAPSPRDRARRARGALSPSTSDHRHRAREVAVRRALDQGHAACSPSSSCRCWSSRRTAARFPLTGADLGDHLARRTRGGRCAATRRASRCRHAASRRTCGAGPCRSASPRPSAAAPRVRRMSCDLAVLLHARSARRRRAARTAPHMEQQQRREANRNTDEREQARTDAPQHPEVARHGGPHAPYHSLFTTAGGSGDMYAQSMCLVR